MGTGQTDADRTLPLPLLPLLRCDCRACDYWGRGAYRGDRATRGRAHPRQTAGHAASAAPAWGSRSDPILPGWWGRGGRWMNQWPQSRASSPFSLPHVHSAHARILGHAHVCAHVCARVCARVCVRSNEWKGPTAWQPTSLQPCLQLMSERPSWNLPLTASYRRQPCCEWAEQAGPLPAVG